MRWKWCALLGFTATAGPSQVACSFPPSCYLGTIPHPGATNVDSDVIIELRDDPFERDMPSLDGAVTLTDLADDSEVPVEIVADADTSTVFIAPVEPLPDGVYRVQGIGRTWSGHWDDSFFYQVDQRTTDFTFEVGGMPTLQHVGLSDDGADLLLGFSEEIDPTTVADHVTLDPPVRFTVDGPLDETPALIQLSLDVAMERVSVSLGEGVRAVDGALVEAADFDSVSQGASALLRVYAGNTHCAGL